MSARRLDWAAAHLGIDGDDKQTLRVILLAVWNDGFAERAVSGPLMPKDRPNPYKDSPADASKEAAT